MTLSLTAPTDYGRFCQVVFHLLAGLALYLTLQLGLVQAKAISDLGWDSVLLTVALMAFGFFLGGAGIACGALPEEGNRRYGKLILFIGCYAMFSFMWVPLAHLIVTTWPQ